MWLSLVNMNTSSNKTFTTIVICQEISTGPLDLFFFSAYNIARRIWFCYTVVLNFSPSMVISLSAVLHVFFPKFVNVFMNCNPFLPSQFFIIWTFSSSFKCYILVLIIFVTSTSKLYNFTYLCGAFQVKDGFLNAGLPCLCLRASPELAVLAPDAGLSSAFLIIIIAAMDAWIATYMTTVWILLTAFQLLSISGIILLCWSDNVCLLRLLLWTPCNVLGLKYNNKNVGENDHLWSVYVQVCIKYINMSVLYYIYIYTGAWLRHGLCLPLVLPLLVSLLCMCSIYTPCVHLNLWI